MKIVSGSSIIVLVVLLAMTGGWPASAADQTATQRHHESPKTRARHAAPAAGRESTGRQPGERREFGRQSGERREGEQGQHGYPGASGLPGVPAPVQAILGGIIGGMLRQQAQPAAPSGIWYYCDASGQYYPYVTTCATGWRGVRPR